jgi:glutathione S-transferase
LTSVEMRLIGSPTSPFVRKVRVLASEMGIEGRIAFEAVDLADPAIDLPAYNPMRKVPTLVLADGTALFDSAVICDFLLHRFGEAPRLPADEGRRWRSRTTEAVADGLLEAGLLARYEGQRAAGERSPAWADKQMGAVARCIDWLDCNGAWREAPVDIGQIAAGCALGWLDFRFPGHGWKSRHPGLAAWQAEFARQPSMAATDPARA